MRCWTSWRGPREPVARRWRHGHRHWHVQRDRGHPAGRRRPTGRVDIGRRAVGDGIRDRDDHRRSGADGAHLRGGAQAADHRSSRDRDGREVASALAPTYALLFAARMVTSMATATFFGNAIVIAASHVLMWTVSSSMTIGRHRRLTRSEGVFVDGAPSRALEGKVALVTDGSRGIGAAIARAPAVEGAAVPISYAASAGEAEAVVTDLEHAGVRAAAYRADHADPRQARDLVGSVAADFGRLDTSSTTPRATSAAGSTTPTGHHRQRRPARLGSHRYEPRGRTIRGRPARGQRDGPPRQAGGDRGSDVTGRPYHCQAFV